MGDIWLGKRDGSPAFYACWLEGKRTRRKSLSTTDEGEAKKKLEELYFARSKPRSGGPLLKAVIYPYWEERAKFAVSSDAMATQKKYCLDHFGDQTVDEATSYDALEGFKAFLTGKGLAPSSVNRTLAFLKASLRLAWKKRVISSVPPIPMLEVGDQEPRGHPIGPEDAAKMIRESSGHLRLFNLLLLGTVARPGAVLDLCKNQVDFEFGLIDLNPPGRKQNKKRRPVVRLPAFLREELKDLPDGCLVQWNGKKVAEVKTAFRKARKRAKLTTRINTYSFRHGLAKWMRAKGVPKWEVEAQLGHRSGTTDRYATVAPDYLQNACAAIESYYEAVTRHLRASEQKAKAA